jgi:hydrogenase maturation protein HypF
MAVAHLRDAGVSCDSLTGCVHRAKLRTINQMLERRVNTPLTSSAGRLFDALASLIGVRDTVSYEGQAAIELEWLAGEVPADGAYPFELAAPRSPEHDGVPATYAIDTRPLIRAVVADVQSGADRRRIARRFHSTVVEIIAATCAAIRKETEIEAVVLSGGVFMNALVASQSAARLSADGFRVYRHVLVPPNDGGLCLGQLAIGAAVLSTGELAPVGVPGSVAAAVGSKRTTRVSELLENRELSSSTSTAPQFRPAHRPALPQEG